MTENNKIIKEMESIIKDFQEIAFTNYHRDLLKNWFLSIIGLSIGGILGIATAYLFPLSVEPLSQSKIDEVAKALLAPSITVSVLFISIIPTISFFYLNELRQMSDKYIKDLKIKRDIYHESPEKELIDKSIAYFLAFDNNLRAGLLRYIRNYLVISILSIMCIILLFIIVPTNYFVVLTILLLITIFTGIMPVFRLVFYRPYLKQTYHINANDIIEKIDFEK